MVQNWEGNLDFFQEIKTALLSFYIFSKKCRNFRSIGFKCSVLIFVDLIFFWQKVHIVDYIDFGAKIKKRSFLIGLMVL